MSAPGSSYSNPVWHRGWRIYRSARAHRAIGGSAWVFSHEEREPGRDIGFAPSIDAAKADIDAREASPEQP